MVATIGYVEPVVADAATEARFHDELGRRAYREGRFVEALEHFLQQHALAPSPTTLYNVAVAAEFGGHLDLAFHFFDEVLRVATDREHSRDAEARREALAPRLALLTIETEPPGATIVVDDEALGDFGQAPRTIAVPPGRHTVRLRRPDFEEMVVDVDACIGERSPVLATLVRLRGELLVRTAAPNAVITLFDRGATVATLVPGEPTSVPVGTYRVRVEAPGYRTLEQWALVAPHEREELELQPTHLARVRGRLLISTTDETAARVSVNGVIRGTTPVALPLPAGSHHVTLERDDHHPWSADLEIRPERTTRLSVTLTPRP